MQHVKTPLDLRIASDIDGIPHGIVKLVEGEVTSGEADGKIDYAIFVNDEYLGSLEASTEQEAVLAGLVKMRDLLILLSEAKR